MTTRADRYTESLGKYQAVVDAALTEMAEQDIIRRVWGLDHTVWSDSPKEITNRLGWLTAPSAMLEEIDRLQTFTEMIRADGYAEVLLLGMGGSSLAPEVFQKTFGNRPGGLPLTVLDSTDPGAVLEQAERIDPTKTLFIVSTKSGGTVETLSFFKFFYNRVMDMLGMDAPGRHFVAITDSGSQLHELAMHYRFRQIFLNDPNIGGRYSALSHFGLVPAALIGVDLKLLLEHALDMVAVCGISIPAADNPAARLGATMAELAKAGRDKLTLVFSPQIESFGDWIEQLIAESTGKNGKGILPVTGEELGPPGVYGDDRVFVCLKLKGDETHVAALAALEEAGHPLLRLHLDDVYDLGGQFFLWEMGTAVAGHRLGIQPFDQPDVEAAKVLARQAMAEYAKTGRLPQDEPSPLTADALDAFLAQARSGDYIAVQAYVRPGPQVDQALAKMRLGLRAATGLAVTVGYGPRFLHSTGQLHKGDRGNGLFIQITADDPRDVPIPDQAGASASSITFGVLKMAQALGDKQALLKAGRRVMWFHLGSDVLGDLKRLTELVEQRKR